MKKVQCRRKGTSDNPHFLVTTTAVWAKTYELYMSDCRRTHLFNISRSLSFCFINFMNQIMQLMIISLEFSIYFLFLQRLFFFL
jgi:hypothetical protein